MSMYTNFMHVLINACVFYIVSVFELKSLERARLCYDNIKKRAKSEIDVAILAPQAILSDIPERTQLNKEILKLLKEDIKLPNN